MTDPDSSLRTYRAPSALLPEGWRSDVQLTVDEDGLITRVVVGTDYKDSDTAPSVVSELRGPVVPGMGNLHSHAFQRAMAGLAEVGSASGEDSFWGWRDVMYGFMDRLTPEDVEAITTQLFVEMLEAGYTCAGEFHYLHHDAHGERYGDPAEMSLRILAAARTTGIGLTLLPVLYMNSGFGSSPPTPSQRRFVMGPDEALDLFLRLGGECRARPLERVGFAFHSLRAVPPWAFSHVMDALGTDKWEPPVHIHAAEQRREVEECVAWSGARPVEWLLSHVGLDERWCVIHATHLANDEISALAASGAVAGLCPTTEANLGDGLFALEPFLEAGGRLGIGSDSHVSVSLVEELRWLEYGQRLASGRRNVVGTVADGSTGTDLFQRAAAGGAQAMGQPIGALKTGERADLVVLDPDHPALIGRSGESTTDSWIFSGNGRAVRDVMVGGAWVVEEGRHSGREQAAARYRATLSRLG